MSKKMTKLKQTDGIASNDSLTSAVVNPIQQAANERGHGLQTNASGLGGLIGGMIGSFAGPLGAVAGAALGAGIGYVIADENAQA